MVIVAKIAAFWVFRIFIVVLLFLRRRSSAGLSESASCLHSIKREPPANWLMRIGNLFGLCRAPGRSTSRRHAARIDFAVLGSYRSGHLLVHGSWPKNNDGRRLIHANQQAARRLGTGQ